MIFVLKTWFVVACAENIKKRRVEEYGQVIFKEIRINLILYNDGFYEMINCIKTSLKYT